MTVNKDTKDIVSVFDNHAQQYAERYADMSIYKEGIKQFMHGFPHGGSILDIACGPGNLLNEIVEGISDVDITGIDLAPQMLELARIRFPSGHFVKLDMREFQSLGKSYDRISCGFGLPYIPVEDCKIWLAMVYEGLTSKGRVFLSTMVKDNVGRERVFPKSGEGNGIKTSYYSPDYLTKLLVELGFNIKYKKLFPTDTDELHDYVLVASKDFTE